MAAAADKLIPDDSSDKYAFRFPGSSAGNVNNDGDKKRKPFLFPISSLGAASKEINYILSMNDMTDLKHFTDGSHSNIFKGSFRKISCVAKVIRQKSLANAVAKKEFQTELDLLSRIRHKCIVTLLGSGRIIGRDGQPRTFLVLECLNGGTLQQLIAKRTFFRSPVLTKQKCLEIALQLASVLAYLHEEMHSEAVLIHRDLKPDNIAFTSDGCLKLIDFGLCICLVRPIGIDYTPFKMSGNTGSLRFMAPEVARGEKYNEKVDIYSFAIIFWGMWTDSVAYALMDRETHYERIAVGGERPPILSGDFDLVLESLLKNAWAQEPQLRPKASLIAETIRGLQGSYSRNPLFNCFFCSKRNEEDVRDSLISSRK